MLLYLSFTSLVSYCLHLWMQLRNPFKIKYNISQIEIKPKKLNHIQQTLLYHKHKLQLICHYFLLPVKEPILAYLIKKIIYSNFETCSEIDMAVINVNPQLFCCSDTAHKHDQKHKQQYIRWLKPRPLLHAELLAEIEDGEGSIWWKTAINWFYENGWNVHWI